MTESFGQATRATRAIVDHLYSISPSLKTGWPRESSLTKITTAVSSTTFSGIRRIRLASTILIARMKDCHQGGERSIIATPSRRTGTMRTSTAADFPSSGRSTTNGRRVSLLYRRRPRPERIITTTRMSAICRLFVSTMSGSKTITRCTRWRLTGISDSRSW